VSKNTAERPTRQDPQQINFKEIQSRLRDEPDILVQMATQFWGDPDGPKVRGRVTWGHSGARHVVTSGRAKGLIVDHGEKYGNPLTWISAERGCDYKDAAAFAVEFIGGSILLSPLLPQTSTTKEKEEKDPAEEERKRIKTARWLWSIAKPIQGTPGEANLRGRGLDVSALPASLRYLLPYKDFSGAIIGAVTDDEGTIWGLTRIYVTPDGGNVLEDGNKLKLGIGSTGKGVVRLPGDRERVYVEGIETGLALHQLGYEVHCVLGVGNFEKHLRSLPKDLPFIIGRDHAHEGEPADLTMRKLLFSLSQEGYAVRMANPPAGLSDPGAIIPNGMDFLNLLEMEGPEGVERAIQCAEVAGPHYKSEPMDPGDISLEIYGAIREVVSSREKKRIGIAYSAGGGKTEQALQIIAKYGKDRFSEFITPTHDLNTEIGNRLREKNPDLPIFQLHGRNDENCEKWELAERVARMGLGVQSSICRKETRDPDTGEVISVSECSKFLDCEYQKQYRGRNQKNTPGVRIRPAESLYHPRHPDAPEPDLIIIDERLPSLIRKATASIAIIADPKNIPGREEAEEGQLSALDEVCPVLLTAILDGLPLRKHLTENGITAGVLKLARSAIGREEGPGIFPDQTAKEQDRILKAFNRKGYGRLARAFGLMQEELETVSEQKHGEFQRVFRSQNKAGEKCLEMRYVPKIYIPEDASVVWTDADLVPEIAEKIVPGISVRTFQAERKNIHVTQVSDRTFSKTSLRKDEEATALLGEVQGFIDQKATRGTLIVATKSILELLKIPDGCRSVHWGKHRGRDDLKDCTRVIVIGREEYKATEYEKITRALFYDDPDHVKKLEKEKLVESMRAYRMRDGSLRTARASVYPHDKAQKFVELGRERETLQAIDRLRFIWNDTPKEVFILCSIPLDITVDELVKWSELRDEARLQDYMAEHGVVPASRREVMRVLNISDHEARYQLEHFTPPEDAVRVLYRQPGQPGSPSEAYALPSHANEESIASAIGAELVRIVIPEAEKEISMNGTKEPEHVGMDKYFRTIDDYRPAPLPAHGDKWGPWWFDAYAGVLNIAPAGFYRPDNPYYVDLAGCQHDEVAYHKVMHVSAKSWATPDVVGNLVKALSRVHELQEVHRAIRKANDDDELEAWRYLAVPDAEPGNWTDEKIRARLGMTGYGIYERFRSGGMTALAAATQVAEERGVYRSAKTSTMEKTELPWEPMPPIPPHLAAKEFTEIPEDDWEELHFWKTMGKPSPTENA